MLKLGVSIGNSTATLSFCIVLLACSQGGTALSNQAHRAVLPLTLSSQGVIPLFAKSQPMRSGVYIYNNTDKDITGINYQIGFNLAGRPASRLNECSVVPASGRCLLTFGIPASGDDKAPFAAQIQVNYKDATGTFQHFGQILNFAYVHAQESGVHIAPNSFINGYSNALGYATIYLYAGANVDKETDRYVIDKLTLGKGLELADHSDLSEMEMSSGTIRAVEVKAIPSSDSYKTSISVKLKNGEQVTQDLLILGRSEPSLLAKSFVPLLRATTEAGSRSSVYLGNAGAQDIIINKVEADSKITIESTANPCNGKLSPEAVCEIPFSVDRTSSGGVNSGKITVAYGGVNTVIPINWLTDQSSFAWASINVQDPLAMIAEKPLTVVATITNDGEYDLTMAVPWAEINSGSAAITVTDGEDGKNKCDQTVLVPGDSCRCTLSILDLKAEFNQSLTLYAKGTYPNGKETLLVQRSIAYIAKGWHPHVSFVRNGDSFKQAEHRIKKQAVYTITNDGDTVLNHLSLQFVPANRLNLESNNCNNLKMGAQCTADISYTTLIGEQESNAKLQASMIADTAYGDKPYSESVIETYWANGPERVALISTSNSKISVCDINPDGFFTYCTEPQVEYMDSNGAIGIDPLSQTVYYSYAATLYYCQYGDLANCKWNPYSFDASSNIAAISIQNKHLYTNLNYSAYGNYSGLGACKLSESGLHDGRSCKITWMNGYEPSYGKNGSTLGGLALYTGNNGKQYAYTQWMDSYSSHQGRLAPIWYVGLGANYYPAGNPDSVEAAGQSVTDPGNYRYNTMYMGTYNNFLYQSVGGSSSGGLQICRLDPATGKVAVAGGISDCLIDNSLLPIAYAFSGNKVYATFNDGNVISYIVDPTSGRFIAETLIATIPNARDIVILGGEK